MLIHFVSLHVVTSIKGNLVMISLCGRCGQDCGWRTSPSRSCSSSRWKRQSVALWTVFRVPSTSSWICSSSPWSSPFQTWRPLDFSSSSRLSSSPQAGACTPSLFGGSLVPTLAEFPADEETKIMILFRLQCILISLRVCCLFFFLFGLEFLFSFVFIFLIHKIIISIYMQLYCKVLW